MTICEAIQTKKCFKKIYSFLMIGLYAENRIDFHTERVSARAVPKIYIFGSLRKLLVSKLEYYWH